MSGKTTLLRFLSSLSNDIVILGTREMSIIKGSLVTKPISYHGGEIRIRLDAARIHLLSHDDPMFPELSLWENVLMGRRDGSGVAIREGYKTFSDLLNSSAIFKGKSVDTAFGTLSSGGKALIRLARPIVWKSSLTLIDEVSGHLDDTNAATFFDWFDKFIFNNGTIVFVSHLDRDEELARKKAASLFINCHDIEVEVSRSGSCISGL